MNIAPTAKPGTAPSSADFPARGAVLRPLRLPPADAVYLMPPLTIDEADAHRLHDAADHLCAY